MWRRPVDLDKDYPRLLAMQRKSWEINFPGEVFFDRSFRQELGRALRTDHVYAYYDEDEFVGWLWLDVRSSARRAHVRHIQVVEEHWGKGMGREIMCDAIHTARVEGCETLTLNVTKANARAMALYAGLGFVVQRDSSARQRMGLDLTAGEENTCD